MERRIPFGLDADRAREPNWAASGHILGGGIESDEGSRLVQMSFSMVLSWGNCGGTFSLQDLGDAKMRLV